MKTKYLIFLLFILGCTSGNVENTDCSKQRLELWQRGIGRVGGNLTYVLRDKVDSCFNDSVLISLAYKEINRHLDTADIFWSGFWIEILDENILSYRHYMQSDYYFDNRLYKIEFIYSKNLVELFRYSNEQNKHIPLEERITFHLIPDSLVQKMRNVANKEQ